MLNSIKKYSKSFFFKLLVGIIILPFLFWGMGDVFSGGSQNVVAKIDSEKVSTRDFINYLRILNLSEQERENLTKSDLIEKILSDYIGKRVLVLELEDLNVHISDTSLKDIIINDETFFKNKKFSRTEYEKFLITSNLTAPIFETNLAEQEKKRQLLSYLSDGIEIPNFLVQSEFNRDNQVKKIEFINLKKFYEKPISEEKYLEVFNKNKDFYSEKFSNFKYSELDPLNIIGTKEYNEVFFEKINEIENKTLDNVSFNDLKTEYNLVVKNTGFISNNLKDINGNEIKEINKKIFENLSKIENINTLEFLNIDEKFYIAELIETKRVQKKINNKKVREMIKAQLVIERKITNNTQIAKDIASNKFTRSQMDVFAKENGLIIESAVLKDLTNNKPFSTGVIKRIFETNDKNINLITDNMLKDNFIIYSKETNFPKILTKNPKYEQYKLRAKLRMANEIYNIYDLSLNEKYKVEINNKALNRIKNSF